jgi:hypothetical protein
MLDPGLVANVATITMCFGGRFGKSGGDGPRWLSFGKTRRRFQIAASAHAGTEQERSFLMQINSERLLFLLAVLMVASYLLHPDDTTKTLAVMVVGGFLTVVKQVVDQTITATTSKDIGTATITTQGAAVSEEPSIKAVK